MIAAGNLFTSSLPDSSLWYFSQGLNRAVTSGDHVLISLAANRFVDFCTEISRNRQAIDTAVKYVNWLRDRKMLGWFALASKAGYAYQITGQRDSSLLYYSLILDHRVPDDVSTYIRVDVLRARAELYADMSDFSRAVADIIEAFRVADTTDLRSMYIIHSASAAIYLEIGDRDQALTHLEQARGFAQRSEDFYLIGNALYYLAEFHRETDAAKAMAYANAGEALFEEHKVPYGILMLRSILGGVYLSMDSLDRAESCFRYVTETASELGLDEEKAKALSSLGMIELRRGRHSAAIVSCTEAWGLLSGSPAHRDKAEVCRCLADAYEGARQPNEALRFRSLQMAYADSARNEADVKEAYKVQYRYETEKRENENRLRAQQQETERVRQVMWRNLIILSLLSGLVIISLLFNRHRLRVLAQKKLAEEQLELAVVQLQDFIKTVQLKNMELENVQGELDQLRNASDERDEVAAQMDELQQFTILTEEDWQRFRILFNRVHQGFLDRLSQRYPQLTQAEMRFVALSKMQLSARQMTSVLGVGDNAIRQYRLRLRKKLGLTVDDQLTPLIMSI